MHMFRVLVVFVVVPGDKLSFTAILPKFTDTDYPKSNLIIRCIITSNFLLSITMGMLAALEVIKSYYYDTFKQQVIKMSSKFHFPFSDDKKLHPDD